MLERHGYLERRGGAVWRCPPPPPTWEASSEFSAVATGGNTSTRTIGRGGQLTHRAAGHQTDVSTRFLTSQTDEVTNARLLQVAGRHGVAVNERLEMFSELSYPRDRFMGVDDRVSATAGVTYAMSNVKRQSFTVEGGLGWTGERRVDLAARRFATSTGAPEYRLTILPGTELRAEAAFDAGP
jgi:hypothetical protein